MSEIALIAQQLRYDNRSFWRNPASAFFTFAFPLMVLVIFNLLFGNEGRGQGSDFIVPAIAAFSLISACYTNVAISMCFTRDSGILKRVRGTPLPPWAFLGSKILHSSLIAVLLVAIVTAAGALFYDVEVPIDKMPALMVTLIVGAATFCALGLAITAVIPNADASPPIVNATILPLLFISDIFIPLDNAPEWLTTLANVFPIKHLSEAMQVAFSPGTDGSGFRPEDLLVMGIWGVAGVVLAARFFSWEPRR